MNSQRVSGLTRPLDHGSAAVRSSPCWDVDDPFDRVHGPLGADDIPNVDLIDDDSDGPDNRGPGSIVGVHGPFLTDGCGRAVLTLPVSMQPGDNYRAAASVIDDVFGGSSPQVNQTDADAKQYDYPPGWPDPYYSSAYEVPAVWSKMLTVWRKLHVETDSMARPTFAENTIDTFWNEPRFLNGDLLLDIENQDWYDNFENGFIRIQADGFSDLIMLIIAFENSLLFDDVVHTSITEAQWGGRPTSGSHSCTISDDDLANEARFTAGIVGSDIGVGNPPDGFLPLPDTSGLTAYYTPAYILPVVQTEHSSEGSYPFNKNMNPET